MTLDKKILPDKVKFVKHTKKHSFLTRPAISLPVTRDGRMHFNRAIATDLQQRKVERVEIFIDSKHLLIMVTPAKYPEGYRLRYYPDQRGNVTAGVFITIDKKELPGGRYIFMQDMSAKNQLVFAYEQIDFKYGRALGGKKNGKAKTASS